MVIIMELLDVSKKSSLTLFILTGDGDNQLNGKNGGH